MTSLDPANHLQDAQPPVAQSAPLPRSENDLRHMLGLPSRGEHLAVSVRIWGWLVTVLSGLLAAVLRLVGLGHPAQLMFDEIYYVKDAYALSHVGYPVTWDDGADALFAQGNMSAMTDQASFVVHPPLGKWLIAAGEWLFGPGNPVGWRFAPAVFGILTVMLLVRVTLRLTRSPFLAGLAGLLLSIDGVAITESRIGLLDVFIGFFALLSVYCLMRDRMWFRQRLAVGLADTPPGQVAPRMGVRPWLIATGVAAGLTCSIKWSGLYLLAVLGLMVVCWDLLALRKVQAHSWLFDAIVRHGIGDFLRLVPVAGLVYTSTWFSWFLHPGSYKRGWAAAERAANGSVPRGWLPDVLNDWVEFHLSVYRFHVGLDSPHPYQAMPGGWLLQLRPTSFYWPSDEEMGARATSCGSNHCVEAITSIGNIPIWWAAFIALFVVILLGTMGRDWRAWVALSGYLGLYLPWFLYPHRTIFTFYTVAFVPFVVLTLVLALGLASGIVQPARDTLQSPSGVTSSGAVVGTRISRFGAFIGVPRRRVQHEGLLLTAVIVVCAIVFAVLWWPIWTGQTVTYDFWYWHMWLPSWI